MAVDGLIASLGLNAEVAAMTVHWERGKPTEARWQDWPADIHPELRGVLEKQGHARLYSHQREVWELARAGHDVLVTTPTASGKSLACYLPMLDRLLREPQARVLYLAPTKALGQDQQNTLRAWAAQLPSEAGLSPDEVSTYDGDTPQEERRRLRARMRIMISNPDMVHQSLLPFHVGTWKDFLDNLAFVFVDEIHYCRGIFGSHVANVLLRLQRLLAGRAERPPQFLAASATVANVQEFSRQLTGRDMRVVSCNGAPQGEKHVLFCNPPVRQEDTGWRDTYGAVRRLARMCREQDVQCLIFARTRREAELTLTDLHEDHPSPELARREIRGYRGGYLPELRREIERGLRDGSIRAVVATNALELGIDIGGLDCVILKGYPGTVASARQQIGRAGRRQSASVAVLVAERDPVDQYLMGRPDFLLEGTPEHALINPCQPRVLLAHLECALAERPISESRRPPDPFAADIHVTRALPYLERRRRAFTRGDSWFPMARENPARSVQLRNIGRIYDVSEELPDGRQRTVATVDEDRSPLYLHPQAIYIHDGRKYRVESLDEDARKAVVTSLADSDQFTRPVVRSEVEVLRVRRQEARAGALAGYGDVRVTSQVTAFRLMRRVPLRGVEQLSAAAVECREQNLSTQAYWVQVPRRAQSELEKQDMWRDSENDYGPLWPKRRVQVRAAQGTDCSRCGVPEKPGQPHDVHHIRPFRSFGYVPGLNRRDIPANDLRNLCVLCRECHQLLEPRRGQRGLAGLKAAMHGLSPFHLMCDARDLGVSEDLAQGSGIQEQARPETEFDPDLATIFLYENIAGGIGFSPVLFELHEKLLRGIQDRIRGCDCDRGCPACVGPSGLEEEAGAMSVSTRKQLALSLVEALLTEPVSANPAEPVA